MIASPLSIPWLCFLLVYLLVTFFVLLNILLAIIVDAYVEVKDTASHTPSVLDDLKMVGMNAIARIRGKPTLESILSVLDPSESKKRGEKGIKRKKSKQVNNENASAQTKVVPFGEGAKKLEKRPSLIDTDTDMIDDLEGMLEKNVRAIAVDHKVGDGKQITFPLTLEFLMTSFAHDPIWKSAALDGKEAVHQIHAMLSRNHKGIGQNGLEDVQLAAVQRSLSMKVLEYLRSRAKKKS